MDFGNFDVFSDKAEIADADRVLLLEPDQLYPDPENVRRDINPATIEEMAETIKARGQLQPVTVAPKDDDGRYRIQFGERRWRACKQLGIKVRAIVAKSDDAAQVRIDQFIENDQRENLSTADIVAFVAKEVAGGRSIAELARQTGRNRTLLTRYHGLASAPDYIAALLGDISMRSAVALTQAAKVDDGATRTFVANTAAEDMTVLACERLARDVGAKKTTAPVEAPAPTPPPASSNDASDNGEDTRDATDVEDDTAADFTTSAIRDELAERAQDQTPVPAEVRLSVETAPSPRSGKGKAGKQKVERPTVEIDGQRAMIVEALLHFDGEDAPRIMSWR